MTTFGLRRSVPSKLCSMMLIVSFLITGLINPAMLSAEQKVTTQSSRSSVVPVIAGLAAAAGGAFIGTQIGILPVLGLAAAGTTSALVWGIPVVTALALAGGAYFGVSRAVRWLQNRNRKSIATIEQPRSTVEPSLVADGQNVSVSVSQGETDITARDSSATLNVQNGNVSQAEVSDDFAEIEARYNAAYSAYVDAVSRGVEDIAILEEYQSALRDYQRATGSER